MTYKPPSTAYFHTDDLSWVDTSSVPSKLDVVGIADGVGGYVATDSVPTDQEMDEMMSTYLQHNTKFDIVFDPIVRRYTIRLVSKTGKTLVGWAVDYTNVHGRK